MDRRRRPAGRASADAEAAAGRPAAASRNADSAAHFFANSAEFLLCRFFDIVTIVTVP